MGRLIIYWIAKMAKVIFLPLMLLFSLACPSRTFIDPTAGRKDTCEIHNAKMKKMKVPIVYGLSVVPLTEQELKQKQKYFDAKQKLFPNVNEGKVEAGCEVTPQKMANIYVCPVCDKERKRWLIDNDGGQRERDKGDANL